MIPDAMGDESSTGQSGEPVLQTQDSGIPGEALRPDRPKLQRQWEFEDPAVVESRRRWRRALAWAVAIIAVLVLGGLWVRSGADERARHRVYNAAVVADLLRLARAQDEFREATGRYGSLPDLGVRFISSQGVRVRVHRFDSTGWNASAWHLRTSRVCRITVGSGPATVADQPSGDPVCR